VNLEACDPWWVCRVSFVNRDTTTAQGQFSARTVWVAHQSGFLYRGVAEQFGFDVGHRDHESATDAVGCPCGDADTAARAR
jgi:hypothetical protein